MKTQFIKSELLSIGKDGAEAICVTDIQGFTFRDLVQVGEDDFEETIKSTFNFVINNEFIIQLGDDGKFSIPTSDEICWNDDAKQDAAFEMYNDALDDVVTFLDIPSDICDICNHYVIDWYGDDDVISKIMSMCG